MTPERHLYRPAVRWAHLGSRQASVLVDLIPDIAFIVLLGLFWSVYVGPIVVHEQLRGYDICRDAGSAVNMQHGQLFEDPAYKGESLWYPPLSPLVMAGLSSLFDVTAIDCYRWSQLVFNWMIPAGLFLVMRFGWGRRAAILGTIALLLAMPWWQMEVAHGQPSIHSIVWGWVAVLLYARQHQRASKWWALACGVFQGLSFWHHPFFPTVLTAGFLLQTAWVGVRGSWQALHHLGAGQADERMRFAGIVRRNLLIIGVTFLVGGPILYQMLRGPVLNSAGREYLAPELKTVQFALMYGNPWLWAMGLVGLICSVRRADLGSRLLVSCLTVALLGQIPGYARLYGGEWASGIPIHVPHEFQRLFQLGWAISVGIGIDAALHTLTTRPAPSWYRARVGLFRVRPFAKVILTLAACVVTGGWGLSDVQSNLRRYLYSLPKYPQLQEAGRWIVRNTDINDVFACESNLAFQWLNSETGRKVWIIPRGHSNPRVDWHQRARVLVDLQNAPTPEIFWQIARQNGIGYFIPSAEWMPGVIAEPDVRCLALAKYFKVVYRGRRGFSIYQIVPNPPALHHLGTGPAENGI